MPLQNKVAETENLLEQVISQQTRIDELTKSGKTTKVKLRCNVNMKHSQRNMIYAIDEGENDNIQLQSAHQAALAETEGFVTQTAEPNEILVSTKDELNVYFEKGARSVENEFAGMRIKGI